MKNNVPILVLLTCPNKKEAQTIADELLTRKLVACVKQMPVNSLFWWKHNIEEAKETLLVMETYRNKFVLIENEVRKIHSYEQFTLLALPVENASSGVDAWLKESLDM